MELTFSKGLKKILGIYNVSDGLIHLIMAVMGIWGIIACNVHDIRILAPIAQDFIFGGLSILTSYVIGKQFYYKKKNKYEKKKYERPIFKEISVHELLKEILIPII